MQSVAGTLASLDALPGKWNVVQLAVEILKHTCLNNRTLAQLVAVTHNTKVT